MQPKLEVKNLRFFYEEKEIFDDLSFTVAPGEFVSLLGPSGCGKSTVLNLLAGMITPKSGEMRMDGAPFSGMNRHFAYMPQEDLLLSWKTILENVCLYGAVNGGQQEMMKRAASLFPAFGLQGYEHAYPGALSGGMRQRAAFLRTAMCGADMLLLDEPFGALDVITRNDMQDWLVKRRSEIGHTALLVTHDIEEALYLSDRILLMGGGPARIHREIPIKHCDRRDRQWLYDQAALKREIHDQIKGMNAYASPL